MVQAKTYIYIYIYIVTRMYLFDKNQRYNQPILPLQLTNYRSKSANSVMWLWALIEAYTHPLIVEITLIVLKGETPAIIL